MFFHRCECGDSTTHSDTPQYKLTISIHDCFGTCVVHRFVAKMIAKICENDVIVIAAMQRISISTFDCWWRGWSGWPGGYSNRLIGKSQHALRKAPKWSCEDWRLTVMGCEQPQIRRRVAAYDLEVESRRNSLNPCHDSSTSCFGWHARLMSMALELVRCSHRRRSIADILTRILMQRNAKAWESSINT